MLRRMARAEDLARDLALLQAKQARLREMVRWQQRRLTLAYEAVRCAVEELEGGDTEAATRRLKTLQEFVSENWETRKRGLTR